MVLRAASHQEPFELRPAGDRGSSVSTPTKWSQTARLETRFKECYECASALVVKTNARSESEGGAGQHRPIMICGERFELERIRSDPKDGELCLGRVKSGETLMEACKRF